jgi:hypothetical protein
MNEWDTEGIVEIKSHGYPDDFEYSSSGDVHRFHDKNLPEGPEMLAFSSELKMLLNKYFPVGKIPCLYDFDKEQ